MAHDVDVRLRVVVLLLGLVAPLALVTACGGDPEPATGPGLPSQARLASYFGAITGGDVDALTQVQSEVTADGSLAHAYAAYVAASLTAATTAGVQNDATDVEEVDGGFKACLGGSSDQCATWTDLRGQGGRLTDFDINGIELGDLLVDLTGQAPIRSKSLYEVQPDYAYRQPRSGRLYVVCTLRAFDVPLSPKPGTYIEGDQVFDGIEAPSPGIIRAGTTSPIVLGFEEVQDAGLDGQVTFDLKLGGQQAESIGFGLADPAAG